jgi:hypothetical protein
MLNLLFLTVLVSFSYFLESEWNLKKEKDGIIVYTRSVEGSSFEEFKAITTIEHSSLSDVLEILMDVNHYESLYPKIVNTKLLKVDGKYYDIHYFQIEAPWPLKNRDSVYEQKAVVDKDGKHALVTLKPLPDYIPENEDLVRIRKGSGFWDLTEDSNNKVTIIYQFHSEPGGEIPSWLANSFVVDYPFETLTNLKNRIKNK